jgi:hypothetical protein
MNDLFTCPYYYLNDVGLKECVLLQYFFEEIKECTGNIASFVLNKSEICERSRIKFLSQDEVQSGIDNLFKFGFIFFHKKSGKKTRKFSLNIMNIILYELLGKQEYEARLSELDTKKYCGFIIPFDSLKLTDIKIQERRSMTERKKYINFENGDEAVFNDICAVYRFNVRKTSKHMDGDKFIPGVDGKEFPSNVESMFAFAKDSPFFKADEKYRIISIGGVLEGVVDEPDEDESNSGSSSESNSQSEPEVSGRELARNDLMKYYSYMKISIAMKKPIIQWTARDFVAYLYCGIAKLQENRGNFLFPNFAKECTQMKRIMEKWGNKRLNKIIYCMVKKTDAMIEYCGFKDFHLSFNVLNVDWMMERIWDFVQEDEANAQMKKLTEQQMGAKRNPEKSEQITETPLDNSVDGDTLSKYRDSFNKGKEEK